MPRKKQAAKKNNRRNAPHAAEKSPLSPVPSSKEPDMKSPAPENILTRGNEYIPSPFIDGDLFQQEVQVRSRRERNPMHPLERLKSRALNMSRRMQQQPPVISTGENRGHIEKQHENLMRLKQFTVTTKKRRNNTFMGRILRIGNPDDFIYAPSGFMVKYINWTFKSSFSIVFLSFVIIFLLLVLIFGIFFMFAGSNEPDCIVVAGKSLNPDNALLDTFGLSWTTFTTVGYGSTYIATGNEIETPYACVFITLLSTAESFIGLLYAGICTAIMFGKIGRIQSHAQVTFSDAVCIEYGNTTDKSSQSTISAPTIKYDALKSHNTFEGIDEEHEQNFSEDDDDVNISHEVKSSALPQAVTNKKSKSNILCPVIKFQLVNQLSNEGGGEILDARMNVMVRKEKESYPYEPIARFLRVDLEEPSHPYFNRVWHGRHVLNAHSPLVSVYARRLIELNDGRWPEELNNPKSVREHVRFSSLIITMTGISNISAESVQISKRYYKHDILVGYTFAPLLFTTKEDSEMLSVDMSLVNDVVEQSFLFGEKLSANEVELPSLRESNLSQLRKTSRTDNTLGSSES